MESVQEIRGMALEFRIESTTTALGFAAAAPLPMHEQPALFFAGFRLQADGSLFRGNTLIHLPPRELAALKFLIANAGRIVTPAQLKQALWGDVHVTPDSVPKCLSSLRTRLQPEDCIQTVYKRGYRLVADVHQHDAEPAGARLRLAIMPFATDNAAPAHLGSAIAEEAIARLSNAGRSPVSMIARDSVFALAKRGHSAQQVGEILNADLVLAGTLRAFTSHFRLRVEMIRTADGIQIWVEDLLVSRERIAELETELATRLDFRLRTRPFDSWRDDEDRDLLQVSGQDDAGSGYHPAPGSASLSASAGPAVESRPAGQQREAYEAYLRGHHEWQSLERHRMQDGLQHLIRAVELDPSLIAAKVDIARLCITQAAFGFVPPRLAAEIVHSTADSIPDVAVRGAAILPTLGNVSFNIDRDLPAALWAFSSSAHLPHDTWLNRSRVMFALGRHRFSEAIELLEDAVAKDPFSVWLHSRLAWAHHLAGHADESMKAIRHGLSLFPDQEGLALYGAMILPYNGDCQGGLKLAEVLAGKQPYFDLAMALHAYALACAERKDEARAIVDRLQWLSRERFVCSAFNPAVHVALGDHEAALAELKVAEQARCPWFFQVLADPRLIPLHGYAEFQQLRAILTKMEASAAHLADSQA
jgi:DNA-binding winged helix-turn-helix (wHTH) protein/tetratricopeptide (TPR) repeat protein